jgi:hypothetical protein
MQSASILTMTTDEMRATSGGATYTCALLGGFTTVAFLSGQWWAVAGGLIAAYNSGCFVP